MRVKLSAPAINIVAISEEARARYDLTCRLVDKMAGEPTPDALLIAATTFNFARQFQVRSQVDRILDFVPILSMAQASARGLSATDSVARVERLADQLAATPGVVRSSRGNGKTPRPVSGASVILSLFAPDIVAVMNRPAAKALKALGYVAAEKDYRGFSAAFDVEARERSSELEDAVSSLADGNSIRSWAGRFLLQEWLRANQL